MSAIKKFVTLLFLLSAVNSMAQTVVVKKEEQRVKGAAAYGFSTTLESSQEEVNAAMMRYMKTFGKPKQPDAVIINAETLLNGEAYAKPLYALVKGSSTRATAWMGINLSEWGADSTAIITKLENFVKSFGVNFYRDKIQAQVDEAQRAVEAVEKQQQRTQNENKNLQQKVVNNTNEYIQLTKALKNNRTDSVTLQLRLIANRKNQDSLVVVLDQVKKAVELQKDRQRKVN